MSCNCTKATPVPVCTQSLILGAITDHSAAVWVYVVDVSTGMRKRFAAVSTVLGQVTLSMSLYPSFFQSGHAYEVSITLQSATSIQATKDITVGGADYECLQLSFIEVGNDVEGWYPYTSITVAIES